MNRGKEMIDAIKVHPHVSEVKNCPDTSFRIGQMIYGSTQDDDTEIELDAGISRQKLIELFLVSVKQDQTQVWHFMTTPVHHFVVIPWYNQSPPGWSYTVFMAFEGKYVLREYLQNARGNMSQTLKNGYKDEWTVSELADMFINLRTKDTAWGDYFEHGQSKSIAKIIYYKYDVITLEKALANVKKRPAP